LYIYLKRIGTIWENVGLSLLLRIFSSISGIGCYEKMKGRFINVKKNTSFAAQHQNNSVQKQPGAKAGRKMPEIRKKFELRSGCDVTYF